jgi:hypothetical protein
MDTLLLNLTGWDLCLDASGNIAMASQPYSISQDVASAVRLFLGELYYDTTQGIPYFNNILGGTPPMSLVKTQVEQAALTVPNVVSAQCLIAGLVNRVLTGQVQVVDTEGTTTVVNY